MKKICSMGLLLSIVAALAYGAPVSNDDVIKLLSAGLAEPTVIQVIDTADPANFDTSAQGLVKLKKAGANDRVIQAIISRQSGNGNSGSLGGAAKSAAKVAVGGECKPEAPYLLEVAVMRVGGKLVPLQSRRLRANSDVDGASVIGSALTFGIVSVKASESLRLDGSRASIRIQDREPVILDVMVPVGSAPEDQVFLARFTVQDNSRVVITSKAEAGIVGTRSRTGQFDEKVRIPMSPELFSEQCTYKGQMMSIYRAKPKQPLEAGEYAFFSGKDAWDFGVD